MSHWLPVAAYIVLIFTVSARPGLKPPGGFFGWDKLAHLLEYGILGFLLARALRSLPRLATPLAAGLLAVCLGSMVGMVDELFQATVPGRDSSVFDWLADTLGLVVGQIVFLLTRPD